ncbi:MAG: cob(I)yrinic acid a,c-diamide adenosyltransferase, partial [Oscillospiraceae bacterium]
IGCGYRVVIAQFLKDGNSSELKSLSKFPNVTILSGKEVVGFSFTMNEEQKQLVTKNHNEHLKNTISLCQSEGCDMLILDEVFGAISTGLIDYEMLLSFIKNKPPQIEVVMTGRDPSEELIEIADYVSDIHKVKHPYDKGIHARDGIEV